VLLLLEIIWYYILKICLEIGVTIIAKNRNNNGQNNQRINEQQPVMRQRQEQRFKYRHEQIAKNSHHNRYPHQRAIARQIQPESRRERVDFRHGELYLFGKRVEL
jgi:hypothetical protein